MKDVVKIVKNLLPDIRFINKHQKNGSVGVFGGHPKRMQSTINVGMAAWNAGSLYSMIFTPFKETFQPLTDFEKHDFTWQVVEADPYMVDLFRTSYDSMVLGSGIGLEKNMTK